MSATRALDGIDPARIAIVGRGYGGTLALVAASSRPGHYAAAIAVDPRPPIAARAAAAVASLPLIPSSLFGYSPAAALSPPSGCRQGLEPAFVEPPDQRLREPHRVGDGVAYGAITLAEEGAEMAGAIIVVCSLLAGVDVRVTAGELRVRRAGAPSDERSARRGGGPPRLLARPRRGRGGGGRWGGGRGRPGRVMLRRKGPGATPEAGRRGGRPRR